MPVTRRDDSPDPLAPQVLLLWRRKWFIVGVAFAAAVLTYVALLFVGSSYKVNAEIFVNRLPAVPEGETPNPDTVAALLKSQSVIEDVRNDYVKKFDVDPPKIEQFIKGFSVESTVLQDTTVRKELSPVLQLEVEAKGAEDTRFIMESWVRNFIEAFGNYTVDEAVIKRDAYIEEKERLEKQIVAFSRQKAELDAKLPYVKKVLAEKLDQLSPARLFMKTGDEENTPNTVQFISPQPRLAHGLLERYSEMRLRTVAGDISTTAMAEMKALETTIQETQTSISQAQDTYADALFDREKVERDLTLLSATRKAVDDAITRFTVASAVYRQDTTGTLPAGGDIRALSMPVTPEARVWPKRSLSALAAAIVGGILAIFYVLATQYITRISGRDENAG